MGGALCNDAMLQPEGAHPGQYHAVGDPTEGALVVAAARFGLWKSTLETAYPRTDEAPFDSDRKRMTTVHRIADCGAWIADCATITSPHIAFTKGSVDGLMTIAQAVWSDGRPSRWTRRGANVSQTPTRSLPARGCVCWGWRSSRSSCRARVAAQPTEAR